VRIIKAKLTTTHVGKEAIRKMYDEQRIPIATFAGRTRDATDGVFAGRRIVVVSDGATVFDGKGLLDEICTIHVDGGLRRSLATARPVSEGGGNPPIRRHHR